MILEPYMYQSTMIYCWPNNWQPIGDWDSKLGYVKHIFNKFNRRNITILSHKINWMIMDKKYEDLNRWITGLSETIITSNRLLRLCACLHNSILCSFKTRELIWQYTHIGLWISSVFVGTLCFRIQFWVRSLLKHEL